MGIEAASQEKRTGLGDIPDAEALLIGRGIVEERLRDGHLRRRKTGGEKYTIPPTFIIVAGHLGAGKSHVSRKLESLMPSVIIDRDECMDIFTMSRKDDLHTIKRKASYELAYQLTDEYLKIGLPVVLDAPFNAKDFFTNREWVTQMKTIATDNKVPLKVVWCDATPETKLKRMHIRSSTRERDRTPEEVRELANRADIPEIPFDHIVFDTEEMNTRALIDFLGASRITGSDEA